jgi:hypothetical protein
MGNRIISYGHHVQKKKGDQVANLARFHRRVVGVTEHGTARFTAVGLGASVKNDESTPEPEEVMMIEETWM